MNSYSYQFVNSDQFSKEIISDKKLLNYLEQIWDLYNSMISDERGRYYWFELLSDEIKEVVFNKIIENREDIRVARIYYNFSDQFNDLFDLFNRYKRYSSPYIETDYDRFREKIISIVSIDEWKNYIYDILEEPEILKVICDYNQEKDDFEKANELCNALMNNLSEYVDGKKSLTLEEMDKIKETIDNIVEKD